jgi:predicted O-methyltransferase YrrM
MATLAERNPVWAKMISNRETFALDGRTLKVHSQIPAHYAEALYRAVLMKKPTRVIEIGMAFGSSSLAILTALEELKAGELISIDPFQYKDWDGAAVAAIKRSDLEHRHRLITEADYAALPALLKEGTEIQFAYIDGAHTFDYVLLDTFYLDRMLAVGGVLGFNDCNYPAIHKALNFLLSHRHYKELGVGLAATRAWESRRLKIGQWVQRLTGLNSDPAGPARNEDRYFEKVSDEPLPWDFYEPF